MTVDPRQLGRVRRIVAAYMRYWDCAPIVDTAVLCITELLTNVRKHADSNDCVLQVELAPSGMRIVVSDDSPELPVMSEPDWDSECGRGLFLLDSTAAAWGAVPTDSGKDVWVELRPEEVAA
ncbi:ATP-binding protein [Streptomyces sp. NPDC002564]|uniref:ATP-binding protein n=1 Tax=Streptomyces sp. NPDC002564 TaxID=3364649 RepID=UPI0036D0D0D4